MLNRKLQQFCHVSQDFSIARLCHTDFFDYLFIELAVMRKYFYQLYLVQTIIKMITVYFLSDVTHIFKVVLLSLKNMRKGLWSISGLKYLQNFN